MDKNYLQDVIPPAQKKSIRNIPLSSREFRTPNKVSQDIRQEHTERETVEREPIAPPPPRRKEERHFDADFTNRPKKSKKKLVILGSVVLGIIILLVVLMNNFSGATITIYPKQASAAIEATIPSANLENRQDASLLGYKVIDVSSEVSTNVSATGEENVQTKASGKIRIYNEYTEEAQPLVTNTRFQTPEGLIYRIQESISVPGRSGSTPGSIEVEVYADEIGTKYNLSKTTFKIPGFEGKPQYDGFRAETVTEIRGGFDGVKKIVSAEDLETAEVTLKTELKDKLRADVESQVQVSDDFIVIVDDSLMSFKTEEQDGEKEDEVSVILRGSVKAIVMNLQEFSHALAQKSLPTFNVADVVEIVDQEAVSITLTDINPSDLSTLSLAVKGSVDFIWQTDTDNLKGAVAGKSKKELKNELEDFSSIKRAEAVVRPFWKGSFPEDLDKIEIVEMMEDVEN